MLGAAHLKILFKSVILRYIQILVRSSCLKINKKSTVIKICTALFLTFPVVFLAFRSCFLKTTTEHPGYHFNKGENAAWLGVEWVQDSHTTGEVEELANELRRQQIRYIFVFTSYLKPNGEFNSSYTRSATFVQSLKTAYPEVVILAWIGLPLKNSDEFNTGYVDLENVSTQSKIVSFSKEIIRIGQFDGIHLDPEPIVSGDVNILSLLEQIRTAIGHQAVLSIATRRIMPIFSGFHLPWSEQLVWDSNFYSDIANRVDQIAVMTYDSMLPTRWLYQQFVRFQVIQVSQAVSGTDVQLLIGIPTSEEQTKTHNPEAENMTSGLQGVIDGLNDANSNPRVVSGIAVYPYWETDTTEWNTYKSIWLGIEKEQIY